MGILLALQFFSVLPIKKALPMTRATITAMYSTMPVVGVLFGAILMAVYEGLVRTDVSTLFLTIALIVVHIICTGGLHLDGYIDVSDAYFSYGERTIRLEILEDPRTGAFGVISVIVLLLLHVAALYELLTQQYAYTWLLLLVVPILLRCGVMLYFSTMPCAKEKGIAYYFVKNMNVVVVKAITWIVLIMLVIVALLVQVYVIIAAVVMQLLIVYIYRKWSIKHFGGMNGDLSGALYEGSQVLLWLTLLLFI